MAERKRLMTIWRQGANAPSCVQQFAAERGPKPEGAVRCGNRPPVAHVPGPARCRQHVLDVRGFQKPQTAEFNEGMLRRVSSISSVARFWPKSSFLDSKHRTAGFVSDDRADRRASGSTAMTLRILDPR